VVDSADPYDNDQDASRYEYRWLHWRDGRGEHSISMDDDTTLDIAKCFGKGAREQFSSRKGENEVDIKVMLTGQYVDLDH
jgi:hypothetical protein